MNKDLYDYVYKIKCKRLKSIKLEELALSYVLNEITKEEMYEYAKNDDHAIEIIKSRIKV